MGFCQVTQRILDDDAVLRLAEQEPDARRIVAMAHLVVDGGEVEGHLPGELGLEGHRLQVDHHVAAELQVVEEEIDVEVLAPDVEVNLPADEGEAYTELEEKLLDVVDEGLLHLAFPCIVGDREEVEEVRILERLLSEVGLRGRQRAAEVGEGLSLPLVQAGLDLERQNRAAPAVRHGLAEIEGASVRVTNLGEQH